MGESACLMRPFSYASGISNEAEPGNPMLALGESVSFGRFMSESLAWEKWSTFSNNRYVEEAERYAQPGSVAQKKAFFEAHYKRIAAKKAAALLEQANATNPTPEPVLDGGICDIITPQDSQPINVNSKVVVNEQKDVKTPDIESNYIANGNGNELNSDVKPDGLQTRKVDSGNSMKDIEFVDDMASGSEFSGTSQMEKPLLEKNSNFNHEVSSSMSKKKPGLSSLKSSSYRKVPKIPSPPPKPKAAIHPNKENSITPIIRKPTAESTDKKRTPPKSLRTLINFTPARETDKFSTTAIPRKIESSRVAPSSSKISKDCKTPLRTPTTASVNGEPNHPSVTPKSENSRCQPGLRFHPTPNHPSVTPKARTPFDPSATGSKTTGPKWNILSAVYSKSLSACRNKLQSPTISTPFNLRTEERAARRKQKLEEKFNAKETQKVRLQTKLKEKAETELKKLRQNLCFKARPLPDFYREREIPKNQTKKIPSLRPESQNSSTMQDMTSLPPQTPSRKSSGSNHVFKRNSRNPTCSFTSQPKMKTEKNTSQNSQNFSAKTRVGV